MGNLHTFGPFGLAGGALLRDGRPVVVGQRGLALLEALLAADGEVVSKGALMEAGWPGSVVEEGNLTVQIAGLRKALGVRSDGQEWIVTVPRAGYRLPRADRGQEAEQHSPLPSLAVLPFQNLSGDPEQDYFAAGMVDDIIAALSRFRSFAVVSANSALAEKGRVDGVRRIAAELGVRYVLEGSVRRAGNRLRIGAQLVEGAKGGHLWAETYDGTMDDVFAFQDSIAESVVSIVEPAIRRAEIERARQKPPSSLDAYDLYLQASALVLTTAPDANQRAIDLIERSLALDPNFGPAIAIAASAHIARFDRQLPGASDTERMKGAAYGRAGLTLAGTDANTRAISGLAVIILAEEYELGIMALRQAVAENPNSVNVLGYAGVGALRGGDLEEADRYLMRAIGLNASDFISHWLFTGMAHVRLAQGRFEDAAEWAARSQAVDPLNQVTHWMLVAANAHLGRMEEARRWARALHEIAPEVTQERVRRGQSMKDPHRIDVVIEGLRMAGLPER